MEADRVFRGPTDKARKWRPAYDWSRQLVCAAFGLDFGTIILPTHTHKWPVTQHTSRDTGKPTDRVHRQRLAIYMQREHEGAVPSARMTRFDTGKRHLQPYSKANTMIILEYLSGQTEEIADIPHLLSLYVPQQHVPPTTTSVGDVLDLPSSITQTILSHIFTRVRQAWTDQLLLLHDEYTALEDRVYERPADTGVAQHLWAMSQHLHDMLKLINRHAKLISGVQDDYKSVQIRDSRQSLDLSASLWRLSWITFVFLPLNSVASVFGMNVGIFRGSPSLSWYFVVAVPLVSLGVRSAPLIIWRPAIP